MSIQPSNDSPAASFEAKLIAKAWQDEGFKQELLRNPKEVFESEAKAAAPEGTNVVIPEGMKVTVLEQSSSNYYIVLPSKPVLGESEELSEQALEAIAGGGGCFILCWN